MSATRASFAISLEGSSNPDFASESAIVAPPDAVHVAAHALSAQRLLKHASDLQLSAQPEDPLFGDVVPQAIAAVKSKSTPIVDAVNDLEALAAGKHAKRLTGVQTRVRGKRPAGDDGDSVPMKRPSADVGSSSVLKRPAAAPAGASSAILLGCSRCRGSSKGCVSCRNPSYKGKRFQSAGN